MERLTYIDEHSISVQATRERVWAALSSVLRRDFGGAPARLSSAWRLEPSKLSGDWRETPRAGEHAIPGFAVVEAYFPQRLTLRGGHRFSSYELMFELDSAGEEACVLRARSSAEFPGWAGRAYRAAVIGSGAHRLLVPRLLRRIARRA